MTVARMQRTGVLRVHYNLSSLVAASIRAEAGRARHSQSSLARALGMSVSSVNARYNDETPWTLDEVQEVAHVLGVPVSELLRDADYGCGAWCAIRDSNPEPSDMDSRGAFALVLGVAA